VVLRAVGNSTGVILPKTLLDTMGVAEGYHLHVSLTTDGLLLTKFDPDLVRRLQHTSKTIVERASEIQALDDA